MGFSCSLRSNSNQVQLRTLDSPSCQSQPFKMGLFMPKRAIGSCSVSAGRCAMPAEFLRPLELFYFRLKSRPIPTAFQNLGSVSMSSNSIPRSASGLLQAQSISRTVTSSPKYENFARVRRASNALSPVPCQLLAHFKAKIRFSSQNSWVRKILFLQVRQNSMSLIQIQIQNRHLCSTSVRFLYKRKIRVLSMPNCIASL